MEKKLKKLIYYVYKTLKKCYNYYIRVYEGEMKFMKIIKNMMTILMIMLLSIIVLSTTVSAASVRVGASSKVTVRKQCFRNSFFW